MTRDAHFREFLDAISTCFIDDDFEMWRARIIYPFSMITAKGPVILGNDAQLRTNFNLYLAARDVMKLDQIVRHPLAFEDCADASFIGTYETNLLSHGVRAAAPYTSSALLIESDGMLKMTSILNARGHHDWTGKPPPKYH